MQGGVMPRPVRCREIRLLPEFWSFMPEDGCTGESVVMTLDELETIRLLDHAGLTQEACAQQMDVARTTVTAVYESARKKIADCLINGRRLVISGGNWRLHRCAAVPETLDEKGDDIMRVAVTYENGSVFQHFGHTEQFKVYDVQDGKIVRSEVVGTNGQGHGALASFLKNLQVDTLICGGIGGGAKTALAEAGITLYGGVTGSADAAAEALLAGTLAYNPDIQCSHHSHESGDHDCASHSCGSHKCSSHN